MLTENRKNEQKGFERRRKDRRQVDYEFGSPEWIEHVKKNYVAWPRTDRRQTIRRDDENPNASQEEKQSRSLKDDYNGDLLSDEEKLYFSRLFTKNTED